MVQETEQIRHAAHFKCPIHGLDGIPCSKCIGCPKCGSMGKLRTPRGMIHCDQCKGHGWVDRVTRTVLNMF